MTATVLVIDNTDPASTATTLTTIKHATHGNDTTVFVITNGGGDNQADTNTAYPDLSRLIAPPAMNRKARRAMAAKQRKRRKP